MYLGCRYTLGFYPADQRLDVDRAVRVSVKGRGLRAVAANSFEFRSPEKKKESLVLAAFSDPGRSQNGILRAHVFPMEIESRGRWAARIALSFPLLIEGEGTVSRDFAAVLSQGSKVVHSFDRRVKVTSRGVSGVRQRNVSFLEPVVLKPGEYDLRVVLSSPEGGVDSTWAETIDVPGMPDEGAFLIGPILGRRTSTDVVVHGAGQTSLGKKGQASDVAAAKDVVAASGAFEPLLIQQARTTDSGLALLTAVCQTTSTGPTGSLRLERRLADVSGRALRQLAPETVVLPEGKGPRCRTFIDPLAPDGMNPGDYRYEAILEARGRDGVPDLRAAGTQVQLLSPEAAGAAVPPRAATSN